MASAALPPANEVAGFIIGAGLVGLVFAASRLDGIIAKAQIRGFEDDKGERWRAEARANGGNIFVVPEDDEKPSSRANDARRASPRLERDARLEHHRRAVDEESGYTRRKTRFYVFFSPRRRRRSTPVTLE